MVQFYEDEPFLAGAVAEFLGAGLAAAQPLLVVATRSHRKAFAKELTTRGFDVTRAEHSGQLTWLDAHDTLAAFMDGASPDAVRFRSVIGGAMMRARHGRDDTVVRAFGEMVNLLWADGNTDGAVRLEQLWND
ncbi:MAG TPA: MEDS domain-containing protein, partial [Candidatus Elarobacter sp.]|nr:MEDS domain-containing protein [Candidatus Elarobacter sp.]